MQKWYRFVIFALGVAALAVALGACGTNTGNTAAKLCNGQISIATEFPTSGADGSQGLPAQYGVQLAVNQAKLPSGYTLSLITYNDVSATLQKHDPDLGAAHVTDMVGNKCILGFVGPFNSNVAIKEIPISENAGLTMISPANTNPGLTIESTAQDNGITWSIEHPKNGNPESYFRIPGNDVSQGSVDADLVNSLGAKNIYVVDDQETYGEGIANYFEKELTKNGGKELGRDHIPANGAAQIPALAAKIAATKPDAVFYGGVTAGGGGTLKAQLVQAGFTGPLVGGDGIVLDDTYLSQAGAAADGTYASNGAPDQSSYGAAGGGAKFVSDFQAAYPGVTIGAYSASAYDAGNILIKSIEEAINTGNALTRDAVRSGVQSINYVGVTGKISFDAHGDNSGGGVWSFYEVKGGKWVFLKEVGA